jgi:amino acid adenylation domain-containing protein
VSPPIDVNHYGLAAMALAQAAATPDRDALRDAERSYTYLELAQWSSAIAGELSRAGVGHGSRVAVCLERSAAAIAGLLAILRLGAAYVPISPTTPAARAALVVADCEAVLMMSTEGVRLPGDQPVASFVVPRFDPSRQASPPFAVSQVEPTDTAWILYTSGSSGRPKGVLGSHRGSFARIAALWARQPFEPGEVAFQHTAFTTVDSFWEIFAPLGQGGLLHILDDDTIQDVQRLIPRLGQLGVRRITLVPSLLNLIVDLFPDLRKVAPHLSLWVTSGEPLDRGTAQRFFEAAPHARLFNQYGMTETCADVTSYEVPRHHLPAVSGSQFLPVGHPLPGTRLTVVDAAGAEAAPGCSGELIVYGDSLCEGYLNLPELTLERIGPDVRGEPALRTGDLATRLDDGTFVVLGRIDGQVNIRGFRVEPGEIEAILRMHPSVTQAATCLHDLAGQQHLVAHVALKVVGDDGNATLAAIAAHAADLLLPHMQPSHYVVHGSLPTTASGKIDRTALSWHPIAAGRTRIGRLPATMAERIFLESVDAIAPPGTYGVHNTLAEVGFDSLGVMRLAAQLRARWDGEVLLGPLFNGETIEQMARSLTGSRDGARPPSKRATVEPYAPMAHAQERLWFLDQVADGLAAYNIGWVLSSENGFNHGALEATLRAFLSRHETLRSVFSSPGGVNLQSIQAPVAIDLPVRVIPPGELENALIDFASHPLNLATGPLFVAELLRTDGRDEHLAIVVHHIVFDGWSVDVMARELCALYNEFAQDIPADLPVLPLQYGDFASWQRDWLENGELEEQLAYWTQKLRGAPAFLEMPTDRARPPTPSYRGSHLPFHVTSTTTEKLRDLARRHDATLYMVLLAGLATVLSRWSSQDDVLIGSPVACRSHTSVEHLAGFFANTLAMRIESIGADDFGTLLGRVRRTALEAYAHQDVPFASLVEALNPVRDMSRQPVFQVMFALHPAPVDVSRFNQGFTAREITTPTAKFDLALELFDMESDLHGSLEFADDLWDAATMERLLGHLETFLSGVATANDKAPMPSMLSPAERAALLGLSRGAEIAYPDNETIASLFERQANATPEEMAVFFEGQQLSYSMLNARANRLARHLRDLGVRPGVVVGLCITRSAEMMSALLAILKAGAAYLPIDPAYPEDRITFMIDDARVPVIVADTASINRLRDDDRSAVWIDAADPCLDDYDPGNPAYETSPDDVAYLIYTSGSTGRPKGVLIPHRAILNHLTWMQRFHALQATDRVLQNATISFDVSVWQLFWPIINGAAVVVTATGGNRDLGYVVDLVERAGVTVMHMVPSMLQALVETVPPHRLRHVRDFIVGGEALGAELQNRFIERFSARLHNQYGPTETSVEVTHHQCVPRPASSPVPIGKPIMNTQLYILDRYGELCPLGVYGELYIAGAGVGNGYLSRDALNRERFVPDPYNPARRMYRTGDLCRWIASGEIEFAGRLDHQVKLHGLRIETGEIDAVCSELPAVHQTVTIVRQDPSASSRLVTYITGSGVDTAAVMDHARARLPSFMVPSAIVVLAAFPLTPNGKVDRAALPPPGNDIARALVPATTLAENHVVAAVQSLLGVPVSIRDDFFAIGGHSLLAIRLASRLSDAFGSSISVKAIFDHTRLDALAAAIGAGTVGMAGLSAIPVTPRIGDLPLSWSQEALWLFEQMEAGQPVYNVPWTLRIAGDLDIDALSSALSDIVMRHEVLRTVFVFDVDAPMQRIAPPQRITVPTETIESSILPAELEHEAAVLFDLETGPLYRFRLFRTSPVDHCLSVVFHHIVADGWSIDVLMRELCTLYEAHHRRAPSPLSPLSIQYGDFAAWQRERVGGGALDAQIDYWRGQLAGSRMSLDLPTDRPRPSAPSYRGAHVDMVVPRALTEEIRALARKEGATLYMILLAAFAVVVGRLADTDDVVIGSPIAGRGHAACENLIGFFVNTLPMRISLATRNDVPALIRGVRETVLGAIANQDVPFARLIKLIDAPRTGGSQPLVQAMLALYTPDADPVIAGLSLSPREGSTATAKFDLNMEITERPDRLDVRLEYASDLWDDTTILALSDAFTTWLGDATVVRPSTEQTQATTNPHLSWSES